MSENQPIILTSSQRSVAERLKRKPAPPVLVVAGPAGSGKTTLLRALAAEFSRVFFLAPTGKAAARLREVVGRPAYTIHSAMLQPTHVSGARRGLLDGIAPTKSEMAFKGLGKRAVPGSIVVVDEASMLDAKAYTELGIYCEGATLVLVGDPNQLPPVAAGRFSIFTQGLPTITLDQVHRQSEGSPVLKAANRLIASLHDGIAQSPLECLRNLPTIPMHDVLDLMAANVDNPEFVALTYRNASIQEVTRALRAKLGYPADSVVDGEPLLIVSNNREYDLNNGDRCTFLGWADGVAKDFKLPGGRVLPIRLARIRTPDYSGSRELFVRLLLFGESITVDEKEAIEEDIRKRKADEGLIYSQFAYCVSTHKFQGSQARHVLVLYDEINVTSRDTRFKWAYTSITRASGECTICVLPRSSLSSASFEVPKPISIETLKLFGKKVNA